MEINRDTLHKIAHLARLQFTEEEAAHMMTDLTGIVNWVEKLKEVNTQGVEPLTSMSQEVNAFRDDRSQSTLTHEEALRNAPKQDGTFFRVPRVID